MKNSRVAYNFLNKDYHDPVGYKEITCHLIFGVKLEHTRKAGYTNGGKITDPLSSMTYENHGQ